MTSKYGIAFIPDSQNQEIINLSSHFSEIADSYQLGQNSCPHITLYHFFSEENEISELWKKVCSTLDVHTLDLEFKTFSHKTFDNEIFWISLRPNQSSLLTELHVKTAQALQKPIKEHFDPHMTLINTKNTHYQELSKNIELSYQPIKDRFHLSLGEFDEQGQLKKKILTSSVSETSPRSGKA